MYARMNEDDRMDVTCGLVRHADSCCYYCVQSWI